MSPGHGDMEPCLEAMGTSLTHLLQAGAHGPYRIAWRQAVRPWQQHTAHSENYSSTESGWVCPRSQKLDFCGPDVRRSSLKTANVVGLTQKSPTSRYRPRGVTSCLPCINCVAMAFQATTTTTITQTPTTTLPLTRPAPVAVVVGAGPAGIAAASALANRGWKVEVS